MQPCQSIYVNQASTCDQCTIKVGMRGSTLIRCLIGRWSCLVLIVYVYITVHMHACFCPMCLHICACMHVSSGMSTYI